MPCKNVTTLTLKVFPKESEDILHTAGDLDNAAASMW